MKKIVLPLLLAFVIPALVACSGARFGGYSLNEKDAASAIKQLLQLGARDNFITGSFSKEAVMTTVFPEGVRKVLNTVQMLGLTNEVDRFTTTLGTASEKAATASVPVFVNAIDNLQFTDAMRLIKNGGTSATDYLRSSAGQNLRTAIKPAVEEALKEYKLDEQWDKIVKPIGGNRINLDLSTLMAGMVSEAMFRKIAQKEEEVRSQAAARTTPLLQKVFSRNWN
jgi:hypothetical protein